MELDHGWDIPAGSLGKGLKKRLPADIWTALEATYAGAGVEENWEALFKTMELFRDVGEQVGTGLGFAFPIELHQRVTVFAREYRLKGAEMLARR